LLPLILTTGHYSLLTRGSNETSMYLPKRLELSFRLVLALPNASSTGLDCRSLSFTVSTCPLWPVASAMNCKTFLDASVFPEPDSPAQTYVNRHSEQLHVLPISPIFSCDDDYDVMMKTITAIITMTTMTMIVLLKFIPEFYCTFTKLHKAITGFSKSVCPSAWNNSAGLQQRYGEECLLRRHSSPYCCWSLW